MSPVRSPDTFLLLVLLVLMRQGLLLYDLLVPLVPGFTANDMLESTHSLVGESGGSVKTRVISLWPQKEACWFQS